MLFILFLIPDLKSIQRTPLRGEEAYATTPSRADRPFLFLIRDMQSGAILFLGRVMNPTAVS